MSRIGCMRPFATARATLNRKPEKAQQEAIDGRPIVCPSKQTHSPNHQERVRMVLFETIITVPSLAPCLWALWTLCSTGWARISKRNNNSYTFVPEECEQQNIHLKKTVAGDYAYVVFPLLNTLLQLGLACTTATLTYEEAYENAHWSTSFWATALWALSWVGDSICSNCVTVDPLTTLRK